jgi:predicted permease
VTLNLPMSDTWTGQPVQVAGTAPLELNQRPISITQDISPEFFQTLGIALKRGRQFTTRDNAKSISVAIVNENLVHLFWPEYPGGPDPIGKHIVVGNNPELVEIVGIAANVRQWERDDYPRPNIYFPCAQKAALSAMLAVRTEGDPLEFANAVRAQVAAIDPDQPVSGVASMEELVENSEGQLRVMMRLLGTFAGSAALLAVLGLYGVISYSVVRRTREIGIRRALGAQRGDILSLLGGQAVRLALAGALIGLGGAFAVTRLLHDLLYRISATDPATFATIPIALVLVGLAASYIPARRAVRVDPMVALRYE